MPWPINTFSDRIAGNRSAARLLSLTIEERLKGTLERLFRLLGLRYPPKEMYSAYRAVSRRQHDEATAALEFLDNTLERDLKRVWSERQRLLDRLIDRVVDQAAA